MGRFYHVGVKSESTGTGHLVNPLPPPVALIRGKKQSSGVDILVRDEMWKGTKWAHVAAHFNEFCFLLLCLSTLHLNTGRCSDFT